VDGGHLIVDLRLRIPMSSSTILEYFFLLDNPQFGISALMIMVSGDYHFAHSRLLNGWHVGFGGGAMRLGEPTHDWAQSSVSCVQTLCSKQDTFHEQQQSV